MSKTVTLTITRCYHCPYLGEPSIGQQPQQYPDFYCRLTEGHRGVCLTDIPDWCPLPDAPKGGDTK